MKKITSWTSLFLFLFLLSCSRQEDSKSTKVAPAVPDEMTKEYELKAGELQSVADFGEIKYNEVKILNLKIKNTGDEIITGPAVSETPDFSIIYQILVQILNLINSVPFVCKLMQGENLRELITVVLL